MKINYKWLLLLAFGFIACDSDDDMSSEGPDAVMLTSGEADFSTYVAVGSSLSAGYSDGALFIASQINSFPNILASKFQMAGGGAFTQPLMGDNLGGMLVGGNQLLENRLFFNGELPERLPGTPTTEATNVMPGPYNNMGITGAKIFHLGVEGYGSPAALSVGAANPYYVRMASSPGASVIGDALSLAPTFFTLWAGSDDVLAYAVSGGIGEDQAGNFNPETYGSNDITDPAVFSQAFSGILTLLTSNGAKGVVANIPDVTALPYFTTVPHAPLDPTNEDFGPQIPLLNTIFGALNQIFVALGEGERAVVFSETSASPVVIKDESLTDISAQIEAALNASETFPQFIAQFGLPPEAAPGVANLLGVMYGQSRQATEADLLVLTSSSVIGEVNTAAVQFLMSRGLSQELAAQFSVEGITYPLDDGWVLLPSEQNEIKTATTAFNTTIESLASQNGLAFVDAHALMNEVASGGLPFDEFTLNSSLVFGNTFSLDGVHPTARGYAFIANQFMLTIDAAYGSNFEEAGVLAKAGDYGTMYPVELP
ncbi:G-D-S-L family lipolytic protein [Zhouia amylolytica]|uniref:G-D-S-L family lipolytic protein n=1 Tax=Zhouia amylolytica TaxID=376730 RepID=UPI0020CF2001|nr:G-D-S-L family lipolytic protein [Zhouia amylolytica]MCQ0111658.1 G-D-S-L family lipolytic protein [Zhouia amylolytica]